MMDTPKRAVVLHLIPPSQGLGAMPSKHTQWDTVLAAHGLLSGFINSFPLNGTHVLKL